MITRQGSGEDHVLCVNIELLLNIKCTVNYVNFNEICNSFVITMFLITNL